MPSGLECRSLLHAFRVKIDAVEACPGSDVEGFPGQEAIGGGFRTGNPAQFFPFGGKDPDFAFPGQVNAPLGVHCHSITPGVGKGALFSQFPRSSHIVGPNLPGSGIGDVKNPAVGRENESIGTDQISHHPSDGSIRKGDMVDPFHTLLQFIRLPPVSRIGEIEASLAIKGQIVRGIELLSLHKLGHRRDLGSMLTGDSSSLSLTGNQMPFRGPYQTIGTSGILPMNRGYGCFGIVDHDPGIGNVREIDAAIRPDRRSFGEFESIRELAHGSRGGDGGLCLGDRGGGQQGEKYQGGFHPGRLTEFPLPRQVISCQESKPQLDKAQDAHYFPFRKITNRSIPAMSAPTNVTKQEFQAEVRQILDIVIHSLYTDKEIFVRELVSNASDALEKLRHLQHTEKEIFDSEAPLEITITTDAEARTITFADAGIGMTREELVENLGTIAHSGSKKFLQALSETQRKESALIGQFGVGFYSAFMVADKVTVATHSWRQDAEHLVWESDGKSEYSITPSEDVSRGCRIVVHLKEEHAEFCEKSRVQHILENYSNFVPFPILLDGERVNKVEALWMKSKSDISEDEYKEFYKFIAKAWDEPQYRMHFTADAPLDIHALLFVPQENTELFGFGQMDPGVGLYCKKILIDPNPRGLLPDWLRFVRGVIDSADLPLNISRETMQDSSLVKKLNRVVTRRFLKFLEGEAREKPEEYVKFFRKFGRFLREGVVNDTDHREDLAKLLRFESSSTEPGTLTSLADYVSRAKEDQGEIYFLSGDSRTGIETLPYLEAFKSRGIEVIYLTESGDDYVVRNLREFSGKKLVSGDSDTVELPDPVETPAGEALSGEALEGLCAFLKDKMGDAADDVLAGNRLVDSPLAALSPEHAPTAQMREFMKAMNPDQPAPPVKVRIEINPRHPLIHQLAAARTENPELAELVARLLLDQALLTAGFLEDRASMVNRGYSLMETALKK